MNGFYWKKDQEDSGNVKEVKTYWYVDLYNDQLIILTQWVYHLLIDESTLTEWMDDCHSDIEH